MPNIGFWATAGAGGGAAGNTALELISTQILTGTATTVTFSSIPQTYKHLQLRFVGSTTNNGFTLQFQMNGGSSGYSWHMMSNYSTSSYAEASSSTNAIRLSNSFNDLGTTVSAAIMDIPDYTNQNRYQTAKIMFGAQDGSSNARVMLASGVYQYGAGLTSITVLGNTGTFAIGSRFSLYGVKGA